MRHADQPIGLGGIHLGKFPRIVFVLPLDDQREDLLSCTFHDGQFGPGLLHTREELEVGGGQIRQRKQSFDDAAQAGNRLDGIGAAAEEFQAVEGIKHQFTAVAEHLSGACQRLGAVERIEEAHDAGAAIAAPPPSNLIVVIYSLLTLFGEIGSQTRDTAAQFSIKAVLPMASARVRPE